MVCVKPIRIRRGKDLIDVPCGRCINCRIAKRTEWQERLKHETKTSRFLQFLTLTYDDAHVPATSEGAMTLSKDDAKEFLHKMRIYYKRKYGKNAKIRYFLAGEYGSQFMRPHYHVLYFSDYPIDAKMVRHLWKKGFVDYKVCDEKAIQYVTKYINKIDGDKIEALITAGVQLPFHLRSPGHGREFFEKNRYLFSVDGYQKGRIKRGLPRYYKDRLLKEVENDLTAQKKLKAVWKRKAAETRIKIRKWLVEYFPEYRFYGQDGIYYFAQDLIAKQIAIDRMAKLKDRRL